MRKAGLIWSTSSIWTHRHRFSIGDQLIFFVNKGHDVLVVKRDAYDRCSSRNPIVRSRREAIFGFDLNTTGRYYFICSQFYSEGMKLSVLVEPPLPPLPPSSIGLPLLYGQHKLRPIPRAASVELISPETLNQRDWYEEINKLIAMDILFLFLVGLAYTIRWIYKSLHEPMACHAERGLSQSEIELFPLFPYSTTERRALLDEVEDGDTLHNLYHGLRR